MLILKTLIKLLFLGFLLTTLAACHHSDNNRVLKVGTIAGPETQLMVVAQQVADKEYGLRLDIVPFTDYSMPNEALADGSIDVNVFQHALYLQEAVVSRGYKLVAVGKTFIYPMAIYSKRISKLSALHNWSVVAIPNDPSNEARALLLLQAAKLITLKPGAASTMGGLADILSNPKELKFKEIDASQLPRTLSDVDIAVINTNYAMIAGLLPSENGLFVESSKSPYANLVVVRQADENHPQIKQLLDVLHSDEVLKEANKLFKNQAIPAWK